MIHRATSAGEWTSLPVWLEAAHDSGPGVP
jgi:hypothetical protein